MQRRERLAADCRPHAKLTSERATSFQIPEWTLVLNRLFANGVMFLRSRKTGTAASMTYLCRELASAFATSIGAKIANTLDDTKN